MGKNKINEPIFEMLDEKKLEEEYEDSFLRLIMYRYAQKEGGELLKEAEEARNNPEYSPSPEARERFNKMANSFFRKRKLRRLKNKAIKILKAAGMVFLVCAAIFAVTFFSVDAFRGKVLNFIVTMEKEYTSLRLAEGAPYKDISEGLSNVYAPAYIPKGYHIREISSHEYYKKIDYINEDGDIIKFFEYNLEFFANVDTEHTESIKYIKVNGKDEIFIFKNGEYRLSWEIYGKIFVIFAQISEEEFIQIAESIVFIE